MKAMREEIPETTPHQYVSIGSLPSHGTGETKKRRKMRVRFIPENNTLERIWILGKTDFKQRYYNTSLGLLWAFINCFLRFAVFYFIFTTLFKRKIPNYAFYLFLGLAMWMFFSESTNRGIKVLKSKLYLIENIQINKIELFIASIVTSGIGLALNLFVYVMFFAFSDLHFSFHAIYFPFLILNLCILSIGTSFILSSLYINFSDIDQLWDIVLFAIFWFTPIVYRSKAIISKFPFVYYINPLSGIISNARNVILYNNLPDFEILFLDIFYSLLILFIGWLMINKYAPKAAERLI